MYLITKILIGYYVIFIPVSIIIEYGFRAVLKFIFKLIKKFFIGGFTLIKYTYIFISNRFCPQVDQGSIPLFVDNSGQTHWSHEIDYIDMDNYKPAYTFN